MLVSERNVSEVQRDSIDEMVLSDQPNWFCLQFNGQFLKGVQDAEKFLKKIAQDIFGNNLQDVAVVGERFDEGIFESQSESYFFIRCTNYTSHVNKIKRSQVITRVLPTTENPHPVPEQEVEQFKISAVNKEIELKSGDVVRVKRGYLENLMGIITEMSQDGTCVVAFRLFTRQFAEQIPPSNLALMGPVTKYIGLKKGSRRNGNKNKLHRGRDRNHASSAKIASVRTA